MRFLVLFMTLNATLNAASDFPLAAFGDQVGNGGKLVVCRDADDQIVSTQLLDFYESEILYHLSPDLTGDTFLGMARNALDRLLSHDLLRAQSYQPETST